MIEERCQFWAKKRFLKVGSYLRKISKAEICTHVRELDSMSELSGFVYIKSHVTHTTREILSPKGELLARSECACRLFSLATGYACLGSAQKVKIHRKN